MGELLNEDVVPAFVTVKATLLAKNGSAIATEDSFDKISHVLLPKQVTPFLIAFHDVALSQVDSVHMDPFGNLIAASADPVIEIEDQRLNPAPEASLHRQAHQSKRPGRQRGARAGHVLRQRRPTGLGRGPIRRPRPVAADSGFFCHSIPADIASKSQQRARHRRHLQFGAGSNETQTHISAGWLGPGRDAACLCAIRQPALAERPSKRAAHSRFKAPAAARQSSTSSGRGRCCRRDVQLGETTILCRRRSSQCRPLRGGSCVRLLHRKRRVRCHRRA